MILINLITIYTIKAMKKSVLNEINQMKYLFGYQKGRVISEQENLPKMDEDIMEPKVMSDMETEDEDLMDLETMSDMENEFEDFDLGPEVAPAPTREKERTREREKETEKPYRPGRPNRDPGKLPYTDPDTHPQGKESHYDSESEPFEGADSALENLVMKYLKNRD